MGWIVSEGRQFVDEGGVEIERKCFLIGSFRVRDIVSNQEDG